MDPLSIATSLLSAGESAMALYKKGNTTKQALHRCVKEALERSLARRGEVFTELATAIHNTFTEELCYQLFFEGISDFASPTTHEIWAQRFEKHVQATRIVSHEQDLKGISAEFALQLWHEISTDVPTSSPLFAPVFWDSIKALRRDASFATGNELSKIKKEATGINNLADLPLPWGIVNRPESELVRLRMETSPVVVLAGEPGTGKSVMAQLIVRSEEREIIWWFNGTNREALIVSCESFLEAASQEPGKNPISQVREFLGGVRDWLVVIDDARDRNLVESVIPGDAAAGSVIVTTRDGGTFPTDAVVKLESVDEAIGIQMAKAHVDSEDTDSELALVCEYAEGHPLGIVSLARFKTATASTWERVFALLESDPQHALSNSEGTEHPPSFYEVATRIFEDACKASELTAQVMAVLAACQGEVPRILLEAVSLAGHRRLDHAVQVLKASGIIQTTPGVVTCHSLVTLVASSYYPSQVQSTMTERLLKAVEVLCTDPAKAGLLPHQLSAVIERLDRRVSVDESRRLGAHTALAEAFSSRGWIASAHRHLAAVLPSLQDVEEPAVWAGLLARASSVFLGSGAYKEARNLLQEGLDSERELPPLARANLLIMDAWAAESLNDVKRVQESIAEASALLPDDPVIAGMRLYFERGSSTPDVRVEKYLEIAHDKSMPTTLRASFASLASRDLREMRRGVEAVRSAELALGLDEEAEGLDSVLVARDCNDLGSALIDEGRYDEATEHLERAVAIYRAEKADHPHAAVPLLHLGRMRRMQAERSESSSKQHALLTEAQEILRDAERLSRLTSDRSIDLAAILYERAHLCPNTPETLDLLEEALSIDKGYFGEGHPEVGKDLAAALVFAVAQKNSGRAMKYLRTVKQHIKSWAANIPEDALFLVLAWKEGIENGVLPAPTSREALELERLTVRLWVDLGLM